MKTALRSDFTRELPNLLAGFAAAGLFALGMTISLLGFLGISPTTARECLLLTLEIAAVALSACLLRRRRFTAIFGIELAILLLTLGVRALARRDVGDILLPHLTPVLDGFARLEFDPRQLERIDAAAMARHPDAALLRYVLCGAISFFAALTAGRLRHTGILALFAGVVYFVLWEFGFYGMFPALRMCAAAIMMTAAAGGARRMGIPGKPPAGAGAVALILLPLALLITLTFGKGMPASIPRFYAPGVEAALDDVVNFLGGDGFSRPRGGFSLSDFGYNTSLGGPVTPSDLPIFTVAAPDSRALLRASIRTVYTGDAWESAPPGRQYQFGGVFGDPVAPGVFGPDLPNAASGADNALNFTRDFEFRVTLLRGGNRALLTTGGPREIRSESKSFVAFFDMRGELFSKSPLNAGLTYTVTDRAPNVSDAAFATAITACETLVAAQKAVGVSVDPNYAAIRAEYLQLPEAYSPAVRELLRSQIILRRGIEVVYDGDTENGEVVITTITTDSDWARLTPYQRAERIRAFLASYAEYTLDPPPFPSGVDFVEWFLETRRGYCTYFASAMTVLARLADLPARYVEGYSLSNTETDARGAYLVTGENAHAWCEVYFEGIGWIPFDATAASGAISLGGESEPGETPNSPGETESAPPAYVPSDPPREDAPTSNTPAPAPDGAPQNPHNLGPALLRAVGLALLAAILLVTVLALRARDLDRFIARHGARGTMLRFWRDIRAMLRRLGAEIPPGASASELTSPVGVDFPLAEAGALFERGYYGEAEPTREDVLQMRECRRALHRELLRRRRVLAYAVFFLKSL